MPLLHVTTSDAWADIQARGALSATPFVHLCTQDQLPFVLDRFFPGHTGLLLITLEDAGLEIRWESSEPGMAPFPHLYGRAPLSAILSCTPISPPQAGGRSPAVGR